MVADFGSILQFPVYFLGTKQQSCFYLVYGEFDDQVCIFKILPRSLLPRWLYLLELGFAMPGVALEHVDDRLSCRYDSVQSGTGSEAPICI